MCNACCREFQVWCKAFTQTERLLTILEAILFVILVGLLVFVVLHLSVCPDAEHLKHCYGSTCHVHKEVEHLTFSPHVQCTWTPSKKTTPYTRYYEQGWSVTSVAANIKTSPSTKATNTTSISGITEPIKDIVKYSEESDGEEVEEDAARYILALVRIRPGRDITFGCVVTAVSPRWALTAASCLEAIEEVDSLDAFVLLERYGSARAGRTHARAGRTHARGGRTHARGGRTHALADVRVHPGYRRASDAAGAAPDLARDAALLRAHDDTLQPLPLADLLHQALVTIGEEYHILGYGRFRSVEAGSAGRRLRRARVWRLPGGWCAGAGGELAWSVRHLARGRPAAQQPPGPAAGALCAGVLYARGSPCQYCGGAPLLRAGRLHAIMADSPQCGASCEPNVYVSVPAISDWLQSVFHEQ